MMVLVGIPDRLRREYLQKKEDAPLSGNKGDFSLYGHRLSSLYRTLTLGVSWLINRIQIGFSLSKILKSNANQKVPS